MGVIDTLTGDHEQSFSRLVRLRGHGDKFMSIGDPNISFKYCSSVMVSAVSFNACFVPSSMGL